MTLLPQKVQYRCYLRLQERIAKDKRRRFPLCRVSEVDATGLRQQVELLKSHEVNATDLTNFIDGDLSFGGSFVTDETFFADRPQVL